MKTDDRTHHSTDLHPLIHQPDMPGQPVVLVHGSLDSSASFRPCQKHLTGIRSITYDRRGWGAHRKLGPADLTTHIDDLTAILTQHGPAAIAGHSLGATIALTAAANNPHLVTAVLAYEPPLPWLPWWPNRAPWEALVFDAPDPAEAADAMLKAVIGYDSWQHLPEQIRRLNRLSGKTLVAEMRDLCAAEPTFDPTTVTCPVTVAVGGTSLPHHQTTGRRLAQLLPSGHYENVDQAGHPIHLTHPKQFAELLVAATAGIKQL